MKLSLEYIEKYIGNDKYRKHKEEIQEMLKGKANLFSLVDMLKTQYHRKMFVNMHTILCLQCNEIVELVKKNVNKYKAVIIKI